MEKSKKYVYTVTDPCYLLNNESWQRCCDRAEKAAREQNLKSSWDFEEFNTAVEEELKKVNKGFAFACDTGFGDWKNHIHLQNMAVKIKQPTFYADAGMVCVVEVTPELKEYLEKENPDNSYSIGAFFESEEKVKYVNCIGDRSWEVLQVRSANNMLIETDPYEEEEDDDYDNYDEDYGEDY